MADSKTNSTVLNLIAPCGINCRLCRAYIRDKKACPGCREDNRLKSKSCAQCRIKHCEKSVDGGFEYCIQCDEFPCARLVHLDIRYRTRYGTSPIDNIIHIKDMGTQDFVESENTKWTCPACGALLCMHKPNCLSCGYVWRV